MRIIRDIINVFKLTDCQLKKLVTFRLHNLDKIKLQNEVIEYQQSEIEDLQRNISLLKKDIVDIFRVIIKNIQTLSKVVE